MARRKGIFQRIWEAIFGRPTPPRKPSITVTPISTLQRRAINHFASSFSHANIDRVKIHVTQMDRDELEWTINANMDQLRWRARQQPDRIYDLVPLNPWWYR